MIDDTGNVKKRDIPFPIRFMGNMRLFLAISTLGFGAISRNFEVPKVFFSFFDRGFNPHSGIATMGIILVVPKLIHSQGLSHF